MCRAWTQKWFLRLKGFTILTAEFVLVKIDLLSMARKEPVLRKQGSVQFELDRP